MSKLVCWFTSKHSEVFIPCTEEKNRFIFTDKNLSNALNWLASYNISLSEDQKGDIENFLENCSVVTLEISQTAGESPGSEKFYNIWLRGGLPDL